ncbi:hypothetical protein EIP86_011111 [Pleurotus ostreatoroseus]|nr:hypothetical protein EIP86_011111 [Pleurotus ostreatoroseus]
MQIKLIPASSLPTVLFTVTYSEPPDYLGFPASWAQALHRLSADDLELPGTVHAFDKTTWIVAILHSVTFDLARRSVVCTYVDGCTQVWPLDEGADGDEGAGKCLQELESVLRDVNQSAVEAEREKKRLEQVQQNMHRPPASPCPSQTMSEPILPTQATVASTPSGHGKHGKEGKDKEGKHKKQRSLLMSLVACVKSLRRTRFGGARLRKGADVPRSRCRSLVSPNKHGHSSSQHGQTASATVPAPVSPLASPAPSHASVISEVDEDDSVERMSSTALRRRARSTLVNAFRRYVLMRLSAAALPGGYPAWIARSMLSRVEGEMTQMVRDAGGPPDMDPSMGFYYGKTSAMAMSSKAQSEAGATRATGTGPEGEATPSSTVVDEPPPFFEEEDGDADADRDSASTDTDGSSVHTPDSASFDGSPFFSPPRCSSPPPSPPSSPTPPSLSSSTSTASSASRSPTTPPASPGKRQLRRQTIFAHRTPSPTPAPRMMGHGRPNFSPCDLAAYTALSGQRLRLQSVLTRIDAQLAMQAQDERQLQSVLEIKSRRRAWSNKQYMGGALVKDMGLCTPARSSPLARYEPINASDLAETRSAQVTVLEGVIGRPKRGLVITTAESNIMRLFPVCEEDEEEEDPAPPYQKVIDDPPPLTHMHEKDEDLMITAVPTVRLVESRGLEEGENDVVLPLPLQLQRHAVPIRPRTRNMTQGNTGAAYPRILEPETEKLGLSVLEPQTKVELFDVYHSEEDEDGPGIGDVELGLNGCGGKHSEFTLGMDIPEPFTMGIGGRRFDHDEWISVANASVPS